MSCIINHNIDSKTVLGVWLIEEDIDTLRSMVDFDQFDEEKFNSYKNSSKQREFLSVRALLAHTLGRNQRIIYNEVNKPFLKSGSHHISITHSHNLTAIICSEDRRVGIDVEYMKDGVIEKIASKFINKNEVITSAKYDKRLHLYIHWCAKEAIYKICDKTDIYMNGLTIEPFEVKSSGEIRGHVETKKHEESFNLSYCRYDNYVLVWTVETI